MCHVDQVVHFHFSTTHDRSRRYQTLAFTIPPKKQAARPNPSTPQPDNSERLVALGLRVAPAQVQQCIFIHVCLIIVCYTQRAASSSRAANSPRPVVRGSTVALAHSQTHTHIHKQNIHTNIPLALLPSTHTNTHTHTHGHKHTRTQTHTNTLTRTHARAHTDIHTPTHIYVLPSSIFQVGHTHTHTHTLRYTHIYLHIHNENLPLALLPFMLPTNTLSQTHIHAHKPTNPQTQTHAHTHQVQAAYRCAVVLRASKASHLVRYNASDRASDMRGP